MTDEHEVDLEENLYGCYILCCRNEKFKGQTYVGYTVNPGRRIKQHNAGVKAGGAKRTSNRGPWDMVLMVHGFMNCNAALKFEWAWQHPHRSRRLRHLAARRRNESALIFRLRVCFEMLRVGPWCRLPLTVRWIKREYEVEFEANLLPPLHMPRAYGAVVSRKVQPRQPGRGHDEDGDSAPEIEEDCFICYSPLRDPQDKLRCLNATCNLRSHMVCLAVTLSHDDHLLPVEGKCPLCSTSLLWGDLIRAKNGCLLDQLASQHSSSQESSTQDHWANDLQLSPCYSTDEQ